MKTLPCGCRTCGCVCPDHSPDGHARPCGTHAAERLSLVVEALALLSIGLFCATVLVWARLLAGGHFS